MAAGTQIPVEEYLRTSYDPDVDYVDGVIEERTAGEVDHSDLQSKIVWWLTGRAEEYDINALVECRVQVAATRFRVPDVAVVKGLTPDGGVLQEPPYVCIEILSPEDTWSRVEERIKDYRMFGVPNIWVIDPVRRKAWTVTGPIRSDCEDLVLRASDGGLEMPLPPLFAMMDRRRATLRP